MKNPHKLFSYSAMAIAFGGTTTAEAAVNYTDIDPDQSLAYTGDTYYLDVNDDGIDDFQITAQVGTVATFYSSTWYTTTTYQLVVHPLAGAEVAVDGLGFLQHFDPEESIGSGLEFTTAAHVDDEMYAYAPVYYGFRITDAGGTHYGWLRVHDHPASVDIMDYAYETEDAVAIEALAAGTPRKVFNIQAEDISDTHTPADLQITFQVPDDESNIASYRVFISSGFLNLELENTAPSGSYVEVFPDGTDKTINVPASYTDLYGDPINEFDLLRVDVVSTSFTNPIENNRSTLLNAIYGFQVDTATAVHLTQLPGVSAADAMHCDFHSPANMTGVLNFLVYIIPTADLPITDTLGIYTASNSGVLNTAFSPDHFYVMPHDGFDINGNAIEYGVPYVACIQSHTLFEMYSEYQFESLSCSAAITLTEPTTSVSEAVVSPIRAIVQEGGIQVIFSSLQQNTAVDLFDTNGRLIWTGTCSSSELLIPAPAATGIYFVRSTINGTPHVERVVVE